MKGNQAAKIAALAGAVAAGYAAYRWRKAAKAEVERLAEILDWSPGHVVADVGAGRGGMAIAAAERVGAAGHVFATDVDRKKLRAIRRKAAKKALANVTVDEASQTGSPLPAGSCDAILLRGSYHHLTDPASVNASLYQALRPGGLLAVLDFAPRRWLTLIAPVKGVPANRGGHGIPANILIEELTASGFALERTIPRWFLDVYCIVFRKPELV